MTEHGKALLDLHEVAALLFGEDTPATYRRTYRLVQGGGIRHIKSGSRYFVPIGAIEELTATPHTMGAQTRSLRPLAGGPQESVSPGDNVQ